jgi:hypothetical protein
MNMVKRRSALVASILRFASVSLCNAAQTQEKVPIETVARIVRLLEASGYQYSKLTQSAWWVSFHGKSKDVVKVIIIPDRDDLVLLSVIADRAQLDNNAAAKANWTLPERVSVMLDSEDDYIVQVRSPLNLDFRFDRGTLAHPISGHALSFAGFV